MLSNNKRVVRRYAEAFSKGDFEKLVSFFTEDAVVYSVLGWSPVAEALPIWKELHSGLRMTLTVETLVGEDDQVAARYIERGTFAGPFRGKAPTGKSYEVMVMEFFEFRNGKIARRWGARDFASIARQLGVERV